MGLSLRKIVFLTGTRADYGKMKQLMKAVSQENGFECYIFVTGMHLLEKYGGTYREIIKDGFLNIHLATVFDDYYKMDMALANTIVEFSNYVKIITPDMIVVHGDRLEALAGAIVGAVNNIKVAHIEGGEVSGTIDESIRHAVSKISHLHFVSNEEARKRLIQLGENKNYVFNIGSPDIDVMLSDSLPSLEEVKKHYEIEADEYGIFMYHPVTTEAHVIKDKIKKVIDGIIASDWKYIVVYPNNDIGSDEIIKELERLKDYPDRFFIYPSIRFEAFLTLLKNASFIIGNSSAGIREACVYSIPTIDIGTRQSGRYDIRKRANVQHVDEDADQILDAIKKIDKYRIKSMDFGQGNSTERFIKIIKEDSLWNLDIQKRFVDLEW